MRTLLLLALVAAAIGGCTSTDNSEMTAGNKAAALPDFQAAVTGRAEDLPGTIVTPHLEHPLPADKNVLWCNTFQLAWNELCDLMGGPVHMADEPPVVGLLNQRDVTKDDLDDASYVAAAGIIRDGVVKRIREELAMKFGDQVETSLLDAAPADPDNWIAYAYLQKALPFRYAYLRRKRPMTFAGRQVAFFGLENGDHSIEVQGKLANQISVIDYRTKDDDPEGSFQSDDFIIELKTALTDDQLILAMVPPKATLAETVAAVRQRVAESTPGRYDAFGDLLAVPIVDFDVTKGYAELVGKPLSGTAKADQAGAAAMAAQRIRFRLDERGAVLKSEAVAAAPEPRCFVFNKPYLILLQRRGAANPYFTLWVANAELMTPFGRSGGRG